MDTVRYYVLAVRGNEKLGLNSHPFLSGGKGCGTRREVTLDNCKGPGGMVVSQEALLPKAQA
jgi:hypothetical protein